MHQARAQSKPPEWSRPDLVASAERIPQQVAVLFSFEHCGLKTLAAFVLGRSFLALKWFPSSRPFQFAHALFDSLAAKVLNQCDRDAVSRADVMQQEVAVRVNRPVLERVGMEAWSSPNMISDAEFAVMKPTAVVINVDAGRSLMRRRCSVRYRPIESKERG
jgi:hypothetical protein